MNVVSQIIRDGAPLLTVLAIFAALRGQRVTNANAARERLEQARNEARMIVLAVINPTTERFGRQYVKEGVLSLTLDVAGPSPIVTIECVVVEPARTGIEQIRAETLETFTLLSPGTTSYVMDIDTPDVADAIMWRVTWADRYGYAWRSRMPIEGGGEGGEVELIQAPSGQAPIITPTRWQKFRNAVLPYDNWSPDRRPLR